MNELTQIILTTLGSIIIAAGGFVIAWLHQKTRKLEREKKAKDTQIQAIHNGFRYEVYERLGKLEKNDEELKEDMKLIKAILTKEDK